MSVGVPALDAEHKTLIGLINNLQRSVGDNEEHATLGSVLQALAEYVATHFIREERVMAACNYPSLDTHVATHRRLSKRVADLKAAYDADRNAVRAQQCLDFLHKWLIDHICSMDMDYRAWVVGHSDVANAENVADMTGGSPPGGMEWQKLRLLVVDDNQNFADILRTVLGGVGVVDIVVAADIEAAKGVLLTQVRDVVVTDWHLGSQSGLDLVAWLRAQPALAQVPVLVLSAYERASNRDVAMSAGADEFMEKPISARGLLISIARLVQKRRSA